MTDKEVQRGSEIARQICCVECKIDKENNQHVCPPTCLSFQKSIKDKVVVTAQVWFDRNIEIKNLQVELEQKDKCLAEVQEHIKKLDEYIKHQKSEVGLTCKICGGTMQIGGYDKEKEKTQLCCSAEFERVFNGNAYASPSQHLIDSVVLVSPNFEKALVFQQPVKDLEVITTELLRLLEAD